MEAKHGRALALKFLSAWDFRGISFLPPAAWHVHTSGLSRAPPGGQGPRSDLLYTRPPSLPLLLLPVCVSKIALVSCYHAFPMLGGLPGASPCALGIPGGRNARVFAVITSLGAYAVSCNCSTPLSPSYTPVSVASSGRYCGRDCGSPARAGHTVSSNWN